MVMLHEITPALDLSKTSYTGLIGHRACPQAWSYKHLWRLRRPPADEPKVEGRFGLMWHALRAADSIERGRALGSIRYVPESLKIGDDRAKVTTATERPTVAVLEAVEAFDKDLTEDWAALWQEKLGDRPLTLLTNLDRRWHARWDNDGLAEEAPVGVEIGWGRVMPGTEARLVGYTDEVYIDTQREMTVVRDHKTAKGLSASTAASDMMDSQLHLYAWGLGERIEEWGVAPPMALSYDRVNSKAPSQPKLLKSGKLSKQTTRWDLDAYERFCARDDVKAVGYTPEQAVIERITAPAEVATWFQRTRTLLNRNLARAHLQAAVDSWLDSQRTIERVSKRGEASRNMTGSACRWCDFAPLCRAQMLGGPEGEYMIEDFGLETSATVQVESMTHDPTEEVAI